MSEKDSPDEKCRDSGCCDSGGGYEMKVFIAIVIFSAAIFAGLYLVSQGLASKGNIYLSQTPQGNDISSSASVSKKVAPDLLQIQFRVQTDAPDAKVSQSTNAVVMNDLRSRLRTAGVKDSEIETSSYSVEPIYSSNRKCVDADNCAWESVISGYRTTNSIAISSLQLDKAGDIIDAGVKAGSNQTFVDSVSFNLRPGTRTALETNLLTNASVEAKVKAQTMADGLGVRLGKLKTASQGYSYSPVYSNYRVTAVEGAMSAPSTVISPGQIDVSASVSVSYEVGS